MRRVEFSVDNNTAKEWVDLWRSISGNDIAGLGEAASGLAAWAYDMYTSDDQDLVDVEETEEEAEEE